MGQKVSKEAVKAASKATVTDPLTGFTRGTGARIAQDIEQQEFLQRKASPKEMPPELVKFMTDVGPLKPSRSVDPLIRRRVGPNSASRKIENMRLAEHIEGFETKRTTNFSSKEDKVDPNDFGLDILQLYGHISGKASPDLEALSPENLGMINNSIKYLEIPVLLEETTDNSYIATTSEKVTSLLEIHKSMNELPDSRAKLVLEDLWALEK